MKKMNPPWLLLAVTLIAVSSCKKKLILFPFELCNIVTITAVENGNPDTAVYHLEYDHGGRVTGIQSKVGGGTATRTYAYADTTIVVTETSGGSTVTDSVTLNSDGLMLIDVNRNSTSSNYLTTYYYYSGTEVINASLWYNGQFPGPGDYYEYTWSVGNLDIFTPQAGATSTTSYGYTYNSVPAAVGDYSFLMQLLNAPATTVKNTDQVITVQQFMTTTDVTYSHFANGRISGLTLTTSSLLGDPPPDTVTYSYQYGCELPFAETDGK